MTTRARAFDHPIHPMLIPFPIGLWVFSLAADIVFRMGADPVWLTMAFWTMLGGTIGALAAAIPGLIDFLSLTDRWSIRIATMHMVLNVTIVLLFMVNLALRMNGYDGSMMTLVLSVTAVGLLLVSGWLGWELVYRRGVALSPEIEVQVRSKRGAA